MKKSHIAMVSCLAVFLIQPTLSSATSEMEAKVTQSTLHAPNALTGKQLEKLVSGNSEIGVTSHTHSVYELYFAPNHELLFRKNQNDKEIYWGTWFIKGNTIISEWPTYGKHSTPNVLEYVPSDKNTYKPFNKNDACDTAGTYCLPFIVVPGVLSSLKKEVERHNMRVDTTIGNS